MRERQNPSNHVGAVRGVWDRSSKVHPAAHGSFGWGGAAATYFLVDPDPANELCLCISTQVLLSAYFDYYFSFAVPFFNECARNVYALLPDA